MSNNAIAKDLGVDDKTVGSVRNDLIQRSEIPNGPSRTDSQGRRQPASKPARPTVSAVSMLQFNLEAQKPSLRNEEPRRFHRG